MKTNFKVGDRVKINPKKSCNQYIMKFPRNKVAKTKNFYSLNVSKIIFNPPATIVFWEDGTKTVVKCSAEG